MDTDFWDDIATEPEVLDRSTLEHYKDCPFMGATVESKAVTSNSRATDSGQEGHDVMSFITQQFVSTGIADMQEAKAAMQQARPDVQEDVIDAVKRTLWDYIQDLTHVPGGGSRNPADILRFDGGEGDRSGQLAWDFCNVRVTSEVDLLVAGAYREEVFETDWKTGRSSWTAARVAGSFQFNLHAWLIFQNYPGVNTVYVRVWDTRKNNRTPYVAFYRDKIVDFENQLAGAIEARAQAQAALAAGNLPEAWPMPDKCSWCPCILDCPRAATPATRLAEDPAQFAKDTDVIEILYKSRREQLREYVDKHGPITTDDGYAWGVIPKKPSTKAPAISAYGSYTEGK